MKYHTFGKASAGRLDTCERDIQEVMKLAHEWSPFDLTIISGHRSTEEQQQLFHDGRSKKDGVMDLSRHQTDPSEAIDIAPYPVDWEDTARFYVMTGVVYAAANHLGVLLRWGGDWDSDWTLNDQKFYDLGHFETVA